MPRYVNKSWTRIVSFHFTSLLVFFCTINKNTWHLRCFLPTLSFACIDVISCFLSCDSVTLKWHWKVVAGKGCLTKFSRGRNFYSFVFWRAVHSDMEQEIVISVLALSVCIQAFALDMQGGLISLQCFCLELISVTSFWLCSTNGCDSQCV
jgi:hypothetical protein